MRWEIGAHFTVCWSVRGDNFATTIVPECRVLLNTIQISALVLSKCKIFKVQKELTTKAPLQTITASTTLWLVP